jgi:hypothetical protein
VPFPISAVVAKVILVPRLRIAAATLTLSVVLAGCGGGDAHSAEAGFAETLPTSTGLTPPTVSASATRSPSPSVTPKTSASPTAVASSAAPRTTRTWGNPSGGAAVPSEGRAVDTSRPTRVVGKGSAASCTSSAVVAAVAAGGVITFSCGTDPITITMTQTARVVNAQPRIVLDGGGKVTLSGGGVRRILYMNTCDPMQGWTTSHCQDQDTPRLTVQNLTFAEGNSAGQWEEGGGGGAIFVRGGRLAVINSRFIRNRCDSAGPDLGGAAIRVLSQYHGLPVYIVGSTFGGGSGLGGRCSNGGALSSIGVSWVILNSVISHNSAVGNGANPAQAGTPGGGSGGGIYADGNRFTVRIVGTVITHNDANEGGGAVFFVSNDRTGTLSIENSTLGANPNDGFATAGYPGIFFLGSGSPQISGSRIT